MARATISYRPFRFFATVAAILLALGVGMLGSLFSHHFVGASFVFFGLMTLVIGFIGDILVRMWMNQEGILYHAKRNTYRQPSYADDAATSRE